MDKKRMKLFYLKIYKCIEEKGANFLYLIVKNHVFTDGNKTRE